MMNGTSDLVRLVYGVAGQSVEFQELVEALMPVIRGDQVLPAELALELSTALIEIERTAAQDDELYGLVNEHGTAALALSDAGQILALNTAATETFSISTGDGLSALKIARPEFDQFRMRLATVAGPSLVRAYRGGPPGNGSVLLSGVYNSRYRAFVLTALRQHWPESVERAMGDLFHLSRSEQEVLSRLARGMNSDQIAARRGRTPGTVRQQVKSILQKMGVSTQLEAATLAATAAAIASTTDTTAGRTIGLAPIPESEAPLRIGTFTRGDRRIGWRRFGDPAGENVLFLHGPSFGAGEYSADRRLAVRNRLDIYALERPGYGRTDTPAAGEDVLDCHVRDIVSFLSREGLERVTILAHEVALIPALEFAARHPGAVRGILAVSAAPPFLSLEQIETMPVHQGIFIVAARHAPWLARLMVRLLMVRTRQLGPEQWTHVIFQDLEPDSSIMERESLRPGIIGTYSFYLNQMGAGFEVDLQMMLKNWGPVFTRRSVPVVLLHGRKNAGVPVEALDIFRDLDREAPREPAIELVPDAGLTLAVSHPELVFHHLVSLVGNTR